MATLNMANELCESSYAEPDEIVRGYKLWFRGYVSSQTNDLLVGICLAWPIDPNHARYFFSMCGADIVGEYKKGFDLPADWKSVDTTGRSSLEYLAEAKASALERLKKYLLTLFP